MTVKVSAQMCVWRRTLTVYVLFNCREVKKNIFAQNHNLKVFQCKVALTDAKLRGLCTGQLWSFRPEKASLSCVPCNKSWGDTFGRLTPSKRMVYSCLLFYRVLHSLKQAHRLIRGCFNRASLCWLRTGRETISYHRRTDFPWHLHLCLSTPVVA